MEGCGTCLLRRAHTARRVSAKKDDYVPGMYISQSQMELRMLEKLLKDKRKELAAYDLQLEARTAA